MVGGWVCVCANDIEPDLNEHHSRNLENNTTVETMEANSAVETIAD